MGIKVFTFCDDYRFFSSVRKIWDQSKNIPKFLKPREPDVDDADGLVLYLICIYVAGFRLYRILSRRHTVSKDFFQKSKGEQVQCNCMPD